MGKRKKSHLIKDHIHTPPIIVYEADTIEMVVSQLRALSSQDKIIYFYVVDKKERLQGVVSTRALLLGEARASIQEIMERAIVYLHAEDTFEKAVKSLTDHRLLALPVVDKEHRLLGVVDIQMCLEENIDFSKEQRNEDIFQLVGMSVEERVANKPLKSYGKRMPWILCNMIGGIGCAIISYFFQFVLSHVVILAMFIPLVLSLSESISMQAMTHSFQVLRKKHISMKKIVLRMLSELKVALLMAGTSAVLVGVISSLWSGDAYISLTIGAGILFSVIISSLLGAIIPLFLHLRKLDPKVASGPVVLTLADVFTTSIYLSFATWWLL